MATTQVHDRTLDADVAAFCEQARNQPSLTDGTVAEARANYAAAPRPAGAPVAHVVDDSIVGGAGHPIPVRRYSTSDPTSSESPIVVFFHGGGWVLGSVDSHDALARSIAATTEALVVSVDYRLAPEDPFPAAHDDAWSVTGWLAEHGQEWGGDPSRMAVCGDSAGGNIAAGVALRARDEGLTLRMQALIYPCIDTDAEEYGSYEENASGYLLSPQDMRWFWGHYVPARHRANPYAVPARAAELGGLAPALIQTAEFDPLRDEGERYARRLARAGVAVTATRYPGVVHGFVARPHLMARAAVAQNELGNALRAAFAS